MARIPSGGQMPYPPAWRPTHGDPGTATVVLAGPGTKILGYLNLTPRQGKETLANWSQFRVEHNRDEGDRSVRRLAGATGLAFPTGRGSCVRDSYVTRTGSRYIEIACLISGRLTTAVVVGAAPPSQWSRVGGDIAAAIAGVKL